MERVNDKTSAYYQYKACQWAEQYGVVNYKVKGSKMIYNVSYPAYLNNPAHTYQHIIDLNTMKETVTKLGRLDKSGFVNRH